MAAIREPSGEASEETRLAHTLIVDLSICCRKSQHPDSEEGHRRRGRPLSRISRSGPGLSSCPHRPLSSPCSLLSLERHLLRENQAGNQERTVWVTQSCFLSDGNGSI